ncbi:hypothetical protein [Rhodocytophaga aerolata]
MSRKEIEITLEDVELIMGENIHFLNKYIENCFCRNCNPSLTTITNYRFFLNDLEDIILKGDCIKCSSPVARYIETGENKESAGMAKHIREIVKKYKKIKKQ